MKLLKKSEFIALIALIFVFSLMGFSQSIPKPEDILGFKVGADYHLATYTQATDYLKILAKNSDRIKLFDMGKTSMGQIMTYAFISSAENLSQLEKYKQISKKLFLVKDLPSQEAAALFYDSCAFEILPSFEAGKEPKSVAKYPDENPLMSGWIYGDKLIRQKSSILDVPYGSGKIILLGFPVQFRAQSYATFKILFNAIFYGGMNQ